METLLTLTIAVSGIITGIGAIWAAFVARRQAQVTERSLAQTERSLVEQNERSRLKYIGCCASPPSRSVAKSGETQRCTKISSD